MQNDEPAAAPEGISESGFSRDDGGVLEVSSVDDLKISSESFNAEKRRLPPATNQEPGKITRHHVVNPLPLLLSIGLICAIAIAAVVLINSRAGRERHEERDGVSPISRSEVDWMIQGWKQAWERRNVQAYSQYYADSFVGNNYSPNRELTTMNRLGWLNDKTQKFQRSGEISLLIGPVTVNYDAVDAVVSFSQDYESGGYKDHGNKTLRLRKQADGAIKIVQEDFTPTSNRR